MSKVQLCTSLEELPFELQNDIWISKAFKELAVSMGEEATLLKVSWEALRDQFVTRKLSCVAVAEGSIVGHMTCWLLLEKTEGTELPWVELGGGYVRSDYRHTKLYAEIIARMDAVFFNRTNAIAKSTNPVARIAGRKLNAAIPILRAWLPPDVRARVCANCTPSRMRAEHYTRCKRAWGEEQCDASLGPKTDACVFRATTTTHRRLKYPVAPYPEDYDSPE